MMQYAIEHCCRKHLISHKLFPLGDLFVGGKDHAAALVCIRHEAEELVRLVLVYRRVADLVNDDKLGFL